MFEILEHLQYIFQNMYIDYVSTVVKKRSVVATDGEKYHNSSQKISIVFNPLSAADDIFL